MADTLDQYHWDVDREFVLPRIGDLVADGRVEHDTDETETAYFDTAERDLQAYGLVLARRVCDDAEWVLSLPGGETVHFAGSSSVPAQLDEITRGAARGRLLEHIATIRTHRDRYLISDPEGESQLEIDDDELRASLGGRLLAWREVHAAPATKRLRERLHEAGARRSSEPARLTRLLAGDRASPPATPRAAGARALDQYVAAQIDEIVRDDIGLRRGVDPIHDTRVAIRRLRSTIRVFGELVDVFAEDDVAAVESDLKWFAGALGEVRDCQVQRDRLGAALDALADELVLGPVRARLQNGLSAVELPARAAVTEAMESARYADMMAHLQEWRNRAPFHSWIEAPAVRRLANKAQRKAKRRLAAALDADDADLLHRARKAAKRARYAAELMQPIGPEAAKRERKYFKHIQSVLGDHQDTVVAMEWLHRLGAAAGATAGENGFTFGLLYGREQALGADCRAAVHELA